MVDIEVGMELAKETKGTYVFSANNAEAAIPTLYVKKAAFPKGAPTEIIVTVAEAD